MHGAATVDPHPSRRSPWPTKHHHDTTEIELENLRYRLLEMGNLVEKQVRDAVRAFTTRDLNLAEAVIRKESEVNALEMKLDNECAELIALRQPAAIDLRRVLTASKVVSNLEQIGDHAKKIAKFTMAISEINVVHARKVTEIETLATNRWRCCGKH